MREKPNIFSYNNFRNYLLDFYEYKHSEDKYFTKASICRELGLPNSRSYFQDVLNGKLLSLLKIPLFIKCLQLSKDEAHYFRTLVNFNQAVDDPEERELLFEQLISLNRTPKKILGSKEYAYYTQWYHSVIRAILNVVDFNIGGNYQELACMVYPVITKKQARESVKLLREMNLIKENDRGFLKPTEMVISTGEFVRDEIIRQYQSNCFENAKKAILKHQTMQHRCITKMLSLSEDAYRKIEKKLEKFNAEVTSIVHKDEAMADRVYQLAMILFPYSTRRRK